MYKQLPFGPIPDDWQVRSIESLGEIVTGTTPSTSHPEYYDGDIPFVSPKDLGENRYVDRAERTLTELGGEHARMIPAGSLLVTCIGLLGKIGQTKRSLATNQQINAIVPNSELDTDFGYWAAHLLKRQMEAVAGLQVVPIVNKGTFSELRLPVPPPEEQRRIAGILDTVDEAIRQTDELIAKLQQVKAGLLHDLLTRGLDERGRLRDPEKQSDQFVETELGRLPAAWEVENISNACEVHNRLRKPISRKERRKMPGVYPYYGPTGILDYIDEYQFEGQYVLLGEDGDHFLKYATDPMTQLVSGKFNVNNHAHVIQGMGKCSTEWVYYYFLHKDITQYLTRQGAGRLKLNKKTLLTIPLAIPSLREQKRIVDVVDTYQERIRAEGAYRDKLSKLKQGLMQDLLTGRVRVTDVNMEALPA